MSLSFSGIVLLYCSSFKRIVYWFLAELHWFSLEFHLILSRIFSYFQQNLTDVQQHHTNKKKILLEFYWSSLKLCWFSDKISLSFINLYTSLLITNILFDDLVINFNKIHEFRNFNKFALIFSGNFTDSNIKFLLT